jgi:hypothetical protein
VGLSTRRRWGGKKAGVDVVFVRCGYKRVASPSTTSTTTCREKKGTTNFVVQKVGEGKLSGTFAFVLDCASWRIVMLLYDYRQLFFFSSLIVDFVVGITLRYFTLLIHVLSQSRMLIQGGDNK